jgi:hypothetical protein
MTERPKTNWTAASRAYNAADRARGLPGYGPCPLHNDLQPSGCGPQISDFKSREPTALAWPLTEANARQIDRGTGNSVRIRAQTPASD